MTERVKIFLRNHQNDETLFNRFMAELRNVLPAVCESEEGQGFGIKKRVRHVNKAANKKCK